MSIINIGRWTTIYQGTYWSHATPAVESTDTCGTVSQPVTTVTLVGGKTVVHGTRGDADISIREMW